MEVTIRDFSAYGHPPVDGYLLLVPGKGDLGGRRRLAGGSKELVPCRGGVEEGDANPQQVWGGAAGFLLIFLSRGVGGSAPCIRYLGGPPPHMGRALRGGSGKGDDTAGGAAPMAET